MDKKQAFVDVRESKTGLACMSNEEKKSKEGLKVEAHQRKEERRRERERRQGGGEEEAVYMCLGGRGSPSMQNGPKLV